MSERTRALENAASRALLDFVRDPTEAKAEASDNVVWKISEVVVAKITENLTSEMEVVRRIACAEPTETVVGAVKRLVRDRDGVSKKYRKAKDAWENERAETDTVVEAAFEFLEFLDFGNEHFPCKRDGTECKRCRLANALEALEGLEGAEDGEEKS
jgi:hypothetical protein